MAERPQPKTQQATRDVSSIESHKRYAKYVIKVENGTFVEGLINAGGERPFVNIFRKGNLAGLSQAYLHGAIGVDEYHARERQMNIFNFGDPITKASK